MTNQRNSNIWLNQLLLSNLNMYFPLAPWSIAFAFSMSLDTRIYLHTLGDWILMRFYLTLNQSSRRLPKWDETELMDQTG